MLKFGTDIEIPYDVLKALQDDKLVVFCGAGISYYDGKGLPLFPDLVKKAYEYFNRPLPEWDKKNNKYKNEAINKTPAEASFERGFYDKTLEYLENSLSDPIYFRKWLLEQFTCREEGAPDLRYHKALLKLTQLKGGRKGHRIVTTNVDNYFDIAAKELGLDFTPLNQSPLPIPDRQRWQSLTYLHGCANQTRQSNGQELVFTSSDFSKAYLLDGWASRFITEIFREYTVLFIGYGVEDPLVTYLMDGLNANNQISHCFAFADYKGDKDIFDCHDRWIHKKITPILFNAHEDNSGYAEQLKTIENWANEFSPSSMDIEMNVAQIISKEFSSKDENCINDYRKFILYISQNIQADKYTKAQNAFLDTPGHISWLQAFDEPVSLTPEIPSTINFRLTAAQTLSPLNPKPPLHRTNADTPRIDEVPIAGWKPTAQLAHLSSMIYIWLCRHHLDKIELVKWVANKHGALHYKFKDYIRDQLRPESHWHDKLPEDYKDFWQTLVNLPQPFEDDSLSNYFSASIDGLTLVNALRPSLTIKDGYLWRIADDNTPFGVTRFEITIANEELVKEIFDDYKREIPLGHISQLKENLHLYAMDLTSLIKQAWRLSTDLPEKASGKEFPSPLDREHIYSSLGHIIYWTYQACIQLYEKAPQEAYVVWLDWFSFYEKQDCTYFESLILKFIRKRCDCAT